MTQDRLSVREMFALRGIEADFDMPFPAHVASDGRDVRPGGVFVALEGARTDGHRHIGQALERKAGLIVVRRGKRPSSLPVPCIELDDPERELGEVASRYMRYAAPAEVVAVTGSVGKTTTREAIRKTLEGSFVLHAAERSLNTVIGCSSTILTMPLKTKLLLLEFGANSMGEIRNLVRLFPPTVALVTQVAPVHLEGFGSLQGVLKAKMEIAESENLKYFVYDGDNPLLRDAAGNLAARVKAFGVGKEKGEYRVKNPMFHMEKNLPTLSFDLEFRRETVFFRSSVWGEKLSMPVAMGAAVGNILGLGLESCANALSSFTGLKGRGRVLSLSASDRHRFVVDDAYNSNPVSMRSSLETYLSLKIADRKYAILADMKELGEDEIRYHEDLLPLIERLDGVIFVGQNWKRVAASCGKKKWRFVDKWSQAAELLTADKNWEGLLIKGSNSFCLEELVNWLTTAPEYTLGTVGG